MIKTIEMTGLDMNHVAARCENAVEVREIFHPSPKQNCGEMLFILEQLEHVPSMTPVECCAAKTFHTFTFFFATLCVTTLFIIG